MLNVVFASVLFEPANELLRSLAWSGALFPAVGVKQFPTTLGKHKVSVGFIGEVLKDTPTIVTPTGVAGLTFQDEADAANRAVTLANKR